MTSIFSSRKTSLRQRRTPALLESQCIIASTTLQTGSRKSRAKVNIQTDRDFAYLAAARLLYDPICQGSKQLKTIMSMRVKKLKRKYQSQAELRRAIKDDWLHRSNHKNMEASQQSVRSLIAAQRERDCNGKFAGSILDKDCCRDSAEQSTADCPDRSTCGNSYTDLFSSSDRVSSGFTDPGMFREVHSIFAPSSLDDFEMGEINNTNSRVSHRQSFYSNNNDGAHVVRHELANDVPKCVSAVRLTQPATTVALGDLQQLPVPAMQEEWQVDEFDFLLEQTLMDIESSDDLYYSLLDN